MNKITIFIILILVSTFTNATTIDSLLKVATKSNLVLEKAKTYNLIAEEFQQNDPNKMIVFATKALALAKEINQPLIEAKAFQNQGIANIILGDYSKAISLLTSSKAIFEKELQKENKNNSLDIKNNLAKTYGTIGVIFSEQSNYGKGLEYYLKALQLFRETNNLANSARLYNNIGISYLNLENLNKALHYFKRCLKIQYKVKDPTIGITITNIGNIYNKKSDFKNANINYSKALNLFKKYPNPRGLGELYNNIGLYHSRLKEFDSAIFNYNKAIETFNSIDDKFGISDTYYFLGEIYVSQKKYALAIESINKSLVLSKELEVLVQIERAEKKLYEIYASQNQAKLALDHYINYSIAKDSILNHENIKNTIRAELNFEYDKKEFLHKKEKEKNALIYQEKIKRNELKLFFIGLFIVLVFVFIFLLYKRKQAHKTISLKLELIEFEQKALHLQMNPHFVFNCLGSISSFILQNNTDEAVKYLAKFSKLMRLTLEFSKEPLIPIDKEIEGLENYLELEKLRFNNSFSYTISKSDEIEDDVALPSMLLQPFVENAIIHGVIPKKEQGIISIDFNLKEDYLNCTITDNGVGIYTSQNAKEKLVNLHKSMALNITKKRLEMMETNLSKKTFLEIKELKNEAKVTIGTLVKIQIPIQYID